MCKYLCLCPDDMDCPDYVNCADCVWAMPFDADSDNDGDHTVSDNYIF